MEEIKELLS